MSGQQDKLLRYRLGLFMASLAYRVARILYPALISESSMRTTRVTALLSVRQSLCCKMRRSQIISAINLCSNLEQFHSLRKNTGRAAAGASAVGGRWELRRFKLILADSALLVIISRPPAPGRVANGDKTRMAAMRAAVMCC